MSLLPIIPGVYGVLGGGTDPYWSSVVLLLDFEGSDGATSTTDESPTTPHTISFSGDAQIDTAQYAMGSSSLLLDGSAGDSVGANNNADFQPGSGAYTVEAWVRFSSTSGARLIIGRWYGFNPWDAWVLWYNSGNLEFRAKFDTAGSQAAVYSWSPTTDVWYHVCGEINASGVMRLYIDGSQVATTTVSGDSISLGTENLFIGRSAANNAYFHGWVDGVRITKGVARYAGSTFTPPTSYPRA